MLSVSKFCCKHVGLPDQLPPPQKPLSQDTTLLVTQEVASQAELDEDMTLRAMGDELLRKQGLPESYAPIHVKQQSS